MMMFAGAALTALDFLTGLAMDAAKSAAQKSAASASSSAASSFSLTNAASTAKSEAAGTTGASSALSSDTLQTLLALQQDYKQTSSTDLLSLLDGDTEGSATPRNAVLQEAERRLQQAHLLATAAPGQAMALNI
jgi:hypothetical protein